MALPLLPTLAAVRSDVAGRCGLATSGTLLGRYKGQIDGEIRRAQRELFVAYSWLRRNVRIEITLSTGVNTYDLPNALNLGGIHRVGLLEDDGRITELAMDDLTDISNAYRDAGRPRFWKVMGGTIDASPAPPIPTPSASLVVTPAPTGDWTTLVVEGQMRDYAPQEDDDRIVVDSEAVAQMATIRMKEYLGIGGNQGSNRADLITYIKGLRGQEAPVRAFSMLSRQLDGPAYWTNPKSLYGYQPDGTPW